MAQQLILGELTDFLTGNTIPDTIDERYRQKLARILVLEKGYKKDEIRKDTELTVRAGEKTARIRIDYCVSVNDLTSMILRYGAGSLVTRHRPCLAISRVIEPFQIPVVVVTNGEDAEILDGYTGRVSGTGFDEIPDRQTLSELSEKPPVIIPPERKEREFRIIYAFEIDGSCPLG